MKFKKIMIVSFILLLILMIGAVSASSDIETLSQDSKDIISIADDGIVASADEECIFYSEGHINLNDEDADNQAVIVAQFFCDTAGNMSITDNNDYELFRKDVGQVCEDEECRITYGEIKNINYLTTPENVLYLNFYNSNGIKSGGGSFWVQIDESGFGFDPIDVGGDVEFILPEGTVNPSKNEGIISLVSSKDVDGFIDIFNDDGTPIEENIDIDSLDKYTYDDKIAYMIKSNVFDFTELQNGDIIHFFYYGIYGEFYADEFRLVIEDPETKVYFEIINGTDYPEFYIEKEIWTYNDNPVAAMYIPHNENDNKVSYPGYLRVYGPNENLIFEEYIGKNYVNSSLVIYLSDVNYFNGFQDGNIVGFKFVADDGKTNLYERRTFHINGECITLEDIFAVNTTISMVYNEVDKELVSTLKDDIGQPIVGANVIVSINGMNSTINTDDNGQVKVSTKDLSPGTYTAVVSYEGNEVFNPSSASLNVLIKKVAILSAVYDDSSKELVVSLVDAVSGSAIKGASVAVNVGGKNYTVKTASTGEGKIYLADLASGTHVATLSYKGNANYDPATTSVEVFVKFDSRISAVYDDIAKELTVTLLNDATGAPLSGASVAVNVNGVKYTAKINSKGNGVVSLADLALGTYDVTVSFNGGAKSNPSNTSLQILTKYNSRISAVYNDATKALTVTLLNDANGAPLSGATVVVNVGGKNYTAKINNKGKGVVYLTDLASGTHVATVSYNGGAKCNPSSANVTVFVKFDSRISAVYDDIAKDLTVTLLNDATGAPLSGASVVVNVNGASYTVKINSKGNGVVSLADLALGTYDVTVSFNGGAKSNPSNTSLQIVTKYNSRISAVYNDATKALTVTLVNDATGAPISGASVVVNVEGKSYTAKVNGAGKAVVYLTDLTSGTHVATVSYNGGTKCNPSSANVTVFVKFDSRISAVYDDIAKKLTVTLLNDATGAPLSGASVVVNVNGASYTVKINSKGNGVVSLADLAPGTYDVTVSFNGGAKSNPSNTSLQIVTKYNSRISAVYNDATKALTVTLVNDATGAPLSGASVVVNVEGKSYTAKVNGAGKAVVYLTNLEPGTYNAAISYNGGTKCNPSSTNVNVVVND